MTRQGVRAWLRQKQEPLKTEVVQILTKNLAVKDAGLYDRMSLGLPDPDGRIDLDTVRGIHDFFQRRGSIPQPVDAVQFIDTSYVDAAVAQLGPYRP